MRRLISYPIDQKDRGWPGCPTFQAEQFDSIEKGSSANTYILHLFNHFGTHMDAPNHYNPKGAQMHTFPIESFLYERPLLLDIPKGRGEKVWKADLEPFADQIARCDLLMVRSGFEPVRVSDPDEYAAHGPAISCEACQYLMENFVDTMKAIAVDFISLASPADTTDGDEAHRWMCGCHREGNIFIIEDVKMSQINPAALRRAAAIPLYIHGVDSSPVTMWVEED